MTPRYINPAIAYRMFGNAILHDFVEIVGELEQLKEKRLQEGNFKNILIIHSTNLKIFRGALRDPETIKTYILNHETIEKDIESAVVYANKIDKLWKKDSINIFSKI